jgi:preprotein translocase SecE subunit
MEQVETVESRSKVGGAIATVRNFLVDVKAEMKKVAWPTRAELGDATRRVVIMTVVIGTAIGILDVILQKIFVEGVAAIAR